MKHFNIGHRISIGDAATYDHGFALLRGSVATARAFAALRILNGQAPALEALAGNLLRRDR